MSRSINVACLLPLNVSITIAETRPNQAPKLTSPRDGAPSTDKCTDIKSAPRVSRDTCGALPGIPLTHLWTFFDLREWPSHSRNTLWPPFDLCSKPIVLWIQQREGFFEPSAQGLFRLQHFHKRCNLRPIRAVLRAPMPNGLVTSFRQPSQHPQCQHVRVHPALHRLRMQTWASSTTPAMPGPEVRRGSFGRNWPPELR